MYVVRCVMIVCDVGGVVVPDLSLVRSVPTSSCAGAMADVSIAVGAANTPATMRGVPIAYVRASTE